MILLRNPSSGYTYVEALVSLALLGVISYGIYNGVAYLSSQTHRVISLSTKDKEMSALLSTIRTNVDLFQINYDLTDAAKEQMLNVNTLPQAWATNIGITDVKNCPSCPGRLGYVVQPVTGIRGLLQVTVRVTNKELFEGFQDFTFMVAPR